MWWWWSARESEYIGVPSCVERRHITSDSSRIFSVRKTVALETPASRSIICSAVKPSSASWIKSTIFCLGVVILRPLSSNIASKSGLVGFALEFVIVNSSSQNNRLINRKRDNWFPDFKFYGW